MNRNHHIKPVRPPREPMDIDSLKPVHIRSSRATRLIEEFEEAVEKRGDSKHGPVAEGLAAVLRHVAEAWQDPESFYAVPSKTLHDLADELNGDVRAPRQKFTPLGEVITDTACYNYLRRAGYEFVEQVSHDGYDKVGLINGMGPVRLDLVFSTIEKWLRTRAYSELQQTSA